MSKSEPILVVAAVIKSPSLDSRQVLIVRRGPGQSGAGFWEFPGGKVELGESPEQALQREIEEELGIGIRVKDLIGEGVHEYPLKTIRLRVYWATTQQIDLTLTEHDAFQWLNPEEIRVDELSQADRPFIGLIVQGSK